MLQLLKQFGCLLVAAICFGLEPRQPFELRRAGLDLFATLLAEGYKLVSSVARASADRPPSFHRGAAIDVGYSADGGDRLCFLRQQSFLLLVQLQRQTRQIVAHLRAIHRARTHEPRIHLRREQRVHISQEWITPFNSPAAGDRTTPSKLAVVVRHKAMLVFDYPGGLHKPAMVELRHEDAVGDWIDAADEHMQMPALHVDVHRSDTRMVTKSNRVQQMLLNPLKQIDVRRFAFVERYDEVIAGSPSACCPLARVRPRDLDNG